MRVLEGTSDTNSYIVFTLKIFLRNKVMQQNNLSQPNPYLKHLFACICAFQVEVMAVGRKRQINLTRVDKYYHDI